MKEGDTHSVAVHGQILDGEGPLGQETHHLRLQGARSCGGGGGDLCVARFGDAGDQFSAVWVHESDGSGRISGSTSSGGFHLYRWRWQ